MNLSVSFLSFRLSLQVWRASQKVTSTDAQKPESNPAYMLRNEKLRRSLQMFPVMQEGLSR